MQSVTTDHFCSNYGTWKTQPTVTPHKQRAQGRCLAMSLVYSLFDQQVPHPLCPEQGELPQHGSLLLTLLQRNALPLCLLPFLQIKNIFRNSIFRLIHCILFPYYPPDLNIPKMFQIICSHLHVKGK